MFDILFLGIPALGGLLLLVGSIYLGIQSKFAWFAAPAILGLVALLSALSVIMSEPGTGSMGWLSTIFWFVIGLVVLSVVRKRAESRSQPK